TFYMKTQQLALPLAQANRILALAQATGPIPSARCTRATSGILADAGLPLRRTWFPDALYEQMAALPGVTERAFRENDSDDKEKCVVLI
ncbi:MAG: hypothetical protein ACU0CI_01635, partial [Shimia sp.]